jgi:hypothetical protein
LKLRADIYCVPLKKRLSRVHVGISRRAFSDSDAFFIIVAPFANVFSYNRVFKGFPAQAI